MRSNLADVRQRIDQESRALVDAVITEFNGVTDAPAALVKMAKEILYWRSRMQQLAEVVTKIQSEEPFAIIGAATRRGWSSFPAATSSGHSAGGGGERESPPLFEASY